MFDVEKNAKIRADKTRETLKASGLGKGPADRVANRQEQRDIRNGNKWVTKNVGRN